MTVALAAYMRLVNDAGGELLEVGRALAALSDPRARVALPQDEQEATMDPATWQRWYRANLGDDLANFLRDEFIGSIMLQEGEQRTSNFHTRWNAGGGFSWFGLFGVSGGESNETIQRRSEGQTSRIEFKFKNLQSFPITRGQWFKGGLISQFRDRMPAQFWGEGGRLNLIPATVTLVRGMRIEVHTSSEVSEYFFNKRIYGGRAGFRIGPFSFGGSARRVTTHEESSFQRTDFGFVVEDNSERAQVLAVTSIRHADLLQQPEDALPDSRRLDVNEVREGMRLLNEMRAGADGGVEALIQ